MLKEYIFVIVAKKGDVGHYHHTFLVNIKKVNPKEFKIQKGDTVFFVLSEAMTKSTPPQSAARAIQLAK